MGTLNTLISRHSVRTYTGDAVSASDLEKLLKARILLRMRIRQRQPLCRQKERTLHTMFLHLFLFRQRNKIQCLKA